MKYTLSAFLFLSLAIFFPLKSSAQKITFNKYVNIGDKGIQYAFLKYNSFVYHLSSGKLSPTLNFKKGIEISEDSISKWACLYKNFTDTGFLSDDSVKDIDYKEELGSSDSIYFEKIFLEVKEDFSYNIFWSVSFTLYNDQIVEFKVDEKTGRHDLGISIEKLLKLKQKFKLSDLIDLDDLPPPPIISGDEFGFERDYFRTKSLRCGENGIYFEVDSIPDVVNNQLSDQHTNIPGTRLNMIIPKGFKQGIGYAGIEKGENCGVSVMELKGGSFYTNAASFSEKGFAERGIELIDYKELIFNGYPAKYACIRQEPTVKTHLFVFGDSTFSTMITGLYTYSTYEEGEQIKDAILSSTYDESIKPDPFANIAFDLDDTNNKLKFLAPMPNGLVYNLGGKETEESKKGPSVIVMSVPIDESMTPFGMVTMTMNKVISTINKETPTAGLVKTEVKHISNDKVNGYDAFVKEIYGSMDGKKALIYILAVRHNGHAMICQAIITDNIDENLKLVKELAHTVKFRE